MKNNKLVIIYGICVLLYIIIIGLIIARSENNETSRIILSLTTSPLRISDIEPTIRSITLNQTMTPTIVYLNLPKIFARTGEAYKIPTFLKKYPLVKINHINNDEGPITKLLPTIRAERDPDSFIIILDDDIEYDPQFIEQLINGSKKHPNSVISNVCDKSRYIKSSLANPYCDIPEGWGGILFRRSVFKDDFEQYISCLLENKKCFTSDDYIIGNYFAKHNISRVGLNRRPRILKLGLKDDGLRIIDNDVGDAKNRYNDCKIFMEKNNMFYLSP